jgi:hypothetical protein
MHGCTRPTAGQFQQLLGEEVGLHCSCGEGGMFLCSLSTYVRCLLPDSMLQCGWGWSCRPFGLKCVEVAAEFRRYDSTLPGSHVVRLAAACCHGMATTYDVCVFSVLDINFPRSPSALGYTGLYSYSFRCSIMSQVFCYSSNYASG